MMTAGLDPSIVAHGGAAGAAAEIGLTIGILAIFIAVWIRERRARANEGEDEGATEDRLFRDEEDGPV